jgi:broad specificity phosphatase PhoE
VIAFVRHGQTGPNRDGLIIGRSDPSLTEEGRRQAVLLGAILAGEKPATILTSPLVRARETAEAIAAACGLTPEVDERLVELDWGSWEGRPFSGVGASDTEGLRNGVDSTTGGESLRSVRERVANFCLDAFQRDGLVLAVSHVSPIKAAVAWVLSADDEVAWKMFLGLASITRLASRPAGPLLVSFNETAHLMERR